MTRRNEQWVSREFPELLDEISGVAEGANVDYEELLSMNVNTDGAYARAYAVAMECTQVIATGPATVDGKTYVAKTRDLTRGQRLVGDVQRLWSASTLVSAFAHHDHLRRRVCCTTSARENSPCWRWQPPQR